MKKILILFFILTLSASAIVEEKKISLNSAIEAVIKTNPQIKIAKLDVESSKNDIKIASHLLNPSISTFQNIGEVAKGNPQQIGADYTIEILKRGKRKAAARKHSSAVLNNEKYLEQVLVYEVKRAYFDFLLKKTNLKIIEEQKELSKQLLETVQKQGANKTDIIQTRIAYNRAVMYSNIAKSSVISAQNHFNTVMNTSDINYDTLEDSLSDDYKSLLTISPKDSSITFDKIKAYALKNRYDLIAAQFEVETAQEKLKAVKSNLIPDIELQGGYGYLTKGISDVNRFQSGAYAGISLINIPLVYRYQPEIKNAINDIERAKLKYEDIQIDIIRDIQDAWEKYTIAKNNLNFYNDELLKNSHELLEASIKGLKNKELDITGFIVSKKLYLELMLGYNETLAEYYISYALLLKEMNAFSDIEKL